MPCFGKPPELILCPARTFESKVGGTVRGFHKPIMVAGGIGNVKEEHAVISEKDKSLSKWLNIKEKIGF